MEGVESYIILDYNTTFAGKVLKTGSIAFTHTFRHEFYVRVSVKV